MLHINTGFPRSTAHVHATVAEARECQANIDHDMDEPASCPVCDAYGCNGAKGYGCDRYERDERVAREDQEDEAMAAWFAA
jgi:hypothetical protein